MQCKICGNEDGNKIVKVKEMMFGNREIFDYVECDFCECLQLNSVPNDLNKYYDSNYYSYEVKKETVFRKISKYLDSCVYKSLIFNNSGIGKFLLLNFDFLGGITKISISKIIKKLLNTNNNLTLNSNILDVGCGNGRFLEILESIGFNNLYGIDMFISKDLPNHKNITLIESVLDQFISNVKFDLIFLNDSFEHMDNQLENFIQLKNLLNYNGAIIMKLPIKSRYIYKKLELIGFKLMHQDIFIAIH
ncbi:MAG: class I SAM-dependent methyltransferase [Methanobrevibacter sp.]|nr:class I SAM-dependent methyltransferase [Candidatus Methanoflexus mossambicus]